MVGEGGSLAHKTSEQHALYFSEILIYLLQSDFCHKLAYIDASEDCFGEVSQNLSFPNIASREGVEVQGK